MPPLAVCDLSQSLYDGFGQDISFNGIETGAKPWTVGNSSLLYRVHGWGAPYFFINEQGNMAVRPHGEDTALSEEIDIIDVVERVVSQGMAPPLILRFPAILQHRLRSLHSAFERAIMQQDYQGRFQGVYPVKCNPDRFIVEDIVKAGKNIRFGLEAGSKPELMMALSVLCGHGSPEALLICNGYKDVEYVHVALLARQLGVRSVIVLEQEEELEIVIQVGERLGVRPVIGVRAKLSTKHDGHWGETSGEKGKFGLTIPEIVGVVSKLRRAGMLDCLQLLHFHIGSQIPSLELVDEGVSEASHIFCELALMGANMKHIDIGGGLGVDYDGTNSSTSEASIGYSLDGYAEQVVNSIKVACSAKNVKCPIITCESGRGLVSHQSVLVFDVLSAGAKPCNTAEDVGIPLVIEGLPYEMAAVYEELSNYVKSGKYESAFECARSLKAEGTRLFKLGLFSLERRAMVDKIYGMVKALSYEKEQARRKDAADGTVTYHINLSIFKSLPDSWAIGQLFPFAPLHRHEEEPSAQAIFSDLTCDSDGKVATFIGHDDDIEPSNFLRLHPLVPKKPYYIGMFLAGAYQEVLGSMHNLFGMLNVVHVSSGASSGGERFKITRSLPGQNIKEVLRVMQHDPDELFQGLQSRVHESFISGRLIEQEALAILQNLSSSFCSYTYLSNPFSRSKAERYSALESSYCCASEWVASCE
ncbi:unnamed protein product [Calypogeia fissa]